MCMTWRFHFPLRNYDFKRYNLERYGRRSFSVAGPSLWNALPSAIRNSVSLPAFRSSLKTHLFREAFVTLM